MCEQEKRFEDTLSTCGDVESACERFEIRLNDQLDLRNRLDGLSQDEHVLSCICCRSLLLKYEQMSGLIQPELELKSIDLDHDLDLDHDSEAYVRPAFVGGNAGLNSDSGFAANRLVGWSTVLAVMFLIWGTPGREFDASVNRLDTTSVVASMEVGKQLEMAGRNLQAGQLASVSVTKMNFSNFQAIEKLGLGQYWQHASHLPGIEPWQHSVSFAIGWINQGEPRGVQSPLLDSPDVDIHNSELDSPDLSDNVGLSLPCVA